MDVAVAPGDCRHTGTQVAQRWSHLSEDMAGGPDSCSGVWWEEALLRAEGPAGSPSPSRAQFLTCTQCFFVLGAFSLLAGLCSCSHLIGEAQRGQVTTGARVGAHVFRGRSFGQ